MTVGDVTKDIARTPEEQRRLLVDTRCGFTGPMGRDRAARHAGLQPPALRAGNRFPLAPFRIRGE
jgi:hypothetical protein